MVSAVLVIWAMERALDRLHTAVTVCSGPIGPRGPRGQEDTVNLRETAGPLTVRRRAVGERILPGTRAGGPAVRLVRSTAVAVMECDQVALITTAGPASTIWMPGTATGGDGTALTTPMAAVAASQAARALMTPMAAVAYRRV